MLQKLPKKWDLEQMSWEKSNHTWRTYVLVGSSSSAASATAHAAAVVVHYIQSSIVENDK